MAKPRLIETGIGIVPAPIRLIAGPDGRIRPETIVEINAYLQLLASKVNQISFGDNTSYSRTGNLNGQRIPVRTPAIATTPIAIDHSLNRLITGYIVMLQNKPGSLYVVKTESWSNNLIFLASDATDAMFDIILV